MIPPVRPSARPPVRHPARWHGAGARPGAVPATLSPAARRAFALYRGFMRAGSGMIRRDLPLAIAKKVAIAGG
ncbi:hypothetical protein [Streptomyces sp. NPDC094472]|uniref:hypothetical protein n=1 Tax=Streptomyces sp. NPDC094472 TaxID=3155080 RepID=UPI00333488E3